ncbi:MAG: DUF4199 family protein [Flavobacteriales bacterium]
MGREYNLIARKNGLFLGLCLAFCQAVFILKSITDNKLILLTFTVFMSFFAFISIHQGKRLFQQTRFRDMFSNGFKTQVIAALILSLAYFVFLNTFGESFFNTLLDQETASIHESVKRLGLSEQESQEKIEQGLSSLNEMMTPKFLSIKTGFLLLLMSAVISLVISTIHQLISLKDAK